ncbi:adenylate/guanylate cyclase domain-containing protein [Mycobacterium sp. AMU20-3851]|uniref:adenylate/guanylate cyclase domain-containing protein n=1 Tax=Mycobacterium sp. AMU20-3851 TaxID=3122055 RepID=UPI003754DB9C
MTTTTESRPEVTRPGADSPRRRRRTLSRMSIQSKLLIMLLATSVLSALVVGFIGYQSGRSSLREAAFNRLDEVLTAQTRQLEAEFRYLRESLVVYTRGSTAIDAARAFTAGFDDLADATITPAQDKSIVDYYRQQYAEVTSEATGQEVDVRGMLPTSNAQKYLQAHYTAPHTDWDDAIKVDDAGDGSPWSSANARFNDFFRQIVNRFKFEDALLLDTRGNVVYSAYKAADLGTNILAGPFSGGDLTQAYRKSLETNVVDYVGVTDFSNYQPSAAPTAWLVSPVGAAGRIDGVLALQFPTSGVNRIMTMGGNWEAAGMGTTGETFLVGPDGLMRSNSRLFEENPAEFEKRAIEAGTPPDVARQSATSGGNILVQPVTDDATRRALQGQTGTVVEDDYLAREALQAYAPVDLPGLDWAIIANIDSEEAFAPVASFTRNLVLSTAGIIFVVSIAAMLLARLFIRPIRRLEAGAEQISSGDYGVTVPVQSKDEFGDLTVAFNNMSRNLAIKEDLLNEQRQENNRMLLSLMPEQVVARYREGEETIAQDHQNVTVIYAGISGMDELAADLSADEGLELVNGLVRQFDAAAESLGVEKVRTLHNGYLASCGLSVPRLDNVRRTVDFAIEMQRIIDRFNGETGNRLRLRAGIDTGTVTSGLIGRSSLAYDMWGATVDLANSVQSGSPQPGVYVTSRVYDAMNDTRQFVPVEAVNVSGLTEPVWRLSENRA